MGTGPIAKVHVIRDDTYVADDRAEDRLGVADLHRRRRPAGRDALLLRPSRAGRHQPRLGLADVDHVREMKRLLAGAITAAVVGLLLWSGLQDSAPEPTDRGPIAAGPQPVPDSAAPLSRRPGPAPRPARGGRRGDVHGYLAAFTGSLRDRVEREVRERGRDGFAGDLRRAASARKSHAIFTAEPDGPDTCRIVVEAVYPDRNERQTYHLERTPSGWLVAAVDLLRSRSPEEKYGSPAGFVGSDGSSLPVAELGPE